MTSGGDGITKVCLQTFLWRQGEQRQWQFCVTGENAADGELCAPPFEFSSTLLSHLADFDFYGAVIGALDFGSDA